MCGKPTTIDYWVDFDLMFARSLIDAISKRDDALALDNPRHTAAIQMYVRAIAEHFHRHKQN